MGHPSTCVWILVVLTTAACVSERQETGRAPLGVGDAGGDGGSAPDGDGDDGDGDEDDGESGDRGAGGSAPRGDGETCDDGEVQECIIEVGEQGGKKTCFSGSRRCRDERWGPCHYVPGQPRDEG